MKTFRALTVLAGVAIIYSGHILAGLALAGLALTLKIMEHEE